MTQQRLTSIEIEGFTSIRSARVELGAMNVLIGANGAGKSNFVHALELLGRIVEGELGLFVGLNGGASALLNVGDSSARIHLQLEAGSNSYEATLVAATRDELVFESERLHSRAEGDDRPYSRPIGSGHRETRLPDEVGRNPSRVASQFTDLLRGCKVYHFHDTSADAPVKRMVPTADDIRLRNDAGNLAAYLYRLQQSRNPADSSAYRRILGAIQLVAPFFRDFILKPDNNDRILLRWQQKDSDAVFSANQMSDGTLRFVCLVTLLLQPELPGLVVLDEPELGLHPFAIIQLADLLRQASRRSQVLIATQSVTLMNQFEVGDLIVVERKSGSSDFSRPDVSTLEDWLADYSLGELWEKNLLGGRPTREENRRG
ncbi:AAA family ATPase [Amycolatopsis keratiniphila]|uniref:Chromosome segregation protein SMC n=1 Tax=Amycolatopsis keratiniphila subsp. keratiniphila TaxID=227715 RepID=A0A1W2LJL0_9PSEU|nr:AAA family ATPase [Amycolatopsis keratiniphila]OLZ60469.1 chromosome segregation protein SMC [Amycolatopsis keratiniphila subsp. nogabecina]ONF63039.1 chromosome segregation protein SMC [Amycolatopsis keratiniphila subsp. keratiniphila]SDU55756.1 Predicted ATPase [Amycolatopsis keratiniphila]